jgi:hypothetical protein
VPLPQVGDQTLFKVIPYLLQRTTAVSVVKVTNPTSYGGVDFIHYPFKRHNSPASCCEAGYPVFDGLQGLLRSLNVGIRDKFFHRFMHHSLTMILIVYR